MAKYNKQTVELICSFIRDGDSQRIAFTKAGIGESTFYEWAKYKSEFREAIKKAKDDFNATILGKLEASLWKRATGYEVTETETEYVSDANGNPKIKSQKTKVKHIQPDTGALIFALTNVAPDKWVNRQRSEVIETKPEEKVNVDYHFEDLPESSLIEMANQLQDAEFNRRNQDGKESNKDTSKS